MKLELKFFEWLCVPNIFKINGIEADYDDFGEKGDECAEEAEDYGCGDMQFTPIEATKEILSKYNINKKEYNQIAEELLKVDWKLTKENGQEADDDFQTDETINKLYNLLK